MASASFATAEGVAKKVYSELKNLQPECSVITQRSPIDSSLVNAGDGYQIPVLLAPPNSLTYVGSSPTNTTFLVGRPMVTGQATCQAYETDLQENTPWSVFTRLDQKSAAAVESYMALLVMAIMRVMNTRHEASVLLGWQSLGTVASVAGTASAGTITFTPATWRPGLWWAAGPGATLDSWTPPSTKSNATAAIVLVGVSSTAYTINITCGGTLGSEIAAGDLIYFEGVTTDPADATKWVEMPGLITQASTSGTSMGLSNTTYPNWAGNTDSVGGVVTPDVLEAYFGVLRNRQQEGKLTAYMPEITWRSILSQVQSLRYLDSSYSADDQKVGAKKVTISTSRFNNVELVIHSFLAGAEMYIQVDDNVKRVGSREPSFGVPNTIVPGGSDLLMVSGTNAAIAYGTVDAAVINKVPSSSFYLSGITVP